MRVEKVEANGSEITIYVNPVGDRFMKLVSDFRQLRASTDPEGNLYVWDPYVAIHSQVEAALGIERGHALMLRSDRITAEYELEEADLLAIPSIARAYGKYKFDVENDSAFSVDDLDDDEDEDEADDPGIRF